MTRLRSLLDNASSQSETLDLTRPVFSHGQLYTTLTSVQTRFHAIVLLTPGETTAHNITYNELLL